MKACSKNKVLAAICNRHGINLYHHQLDGASWQICAGGYVVNGYSDGRSVHRLLSKMSGVLVLLLKYGNLVRDHISQYSPFDLMSNRQVLSTIDKKILKQMQDYVAALSKHKPMPVIIKDVIIGKATPNKEQLAEMNRTAKMVQAKQTQEREYEVQVAREKAERQKAVADKAYMSEMNLNPQQFIQLKWVETVAQKQGANIDVLVGPAEHMWNIKR